MPFVVGIYEMQVARLDGELAALFETYYHQAFARMMTAEPHLHRVIPVRQSVRVDYEIQPYESAVEIIEKSRAWGVTDCICRKQKALVGDPCNHPVDVCIWLSTVVGVFDNDSKVRVVSKEEALNTLERAAKAGLIHSTANNQQTIRYICNCCTCSCGFLRGMADLGLANVIARSAFVLEVATEQCLGCESCVEYCQFGALTMDGSVVSVDRQRCVGCGVCTRNCPEDALVLIRRPEHEIKPIPANEAEWGIKRAANRGLDLNPVR
jgi:Fe-S-cluster-containing hydrogenase component 2